MSTTKKLLLVLGLAAVGGGAYYLYKAGKLVATPNLAVATPTTAAVGIKLTPAQRYALLQKTAKTRMAIFNSLKSLQA